MRRLLALVAVLLGLVALAGCNDDAVSLPMQPAVQLAPPLAPVGSAAMALGGLRVQGPDALTGYARSRFLPHGWADPDGNGCDARRDTLARQAVVPPVVAGAHHCVFTATVHDPYSGTDLPSTRTDVDHVVALADAWETGASWWAASVRMKLANDPLNLVAVSASLNRSKGDQDAASWLPPAKGYRCAYVARQVAVKARYGLWVTPAEHDAMARVLAACPTEPLPR